LSNARRFLCAHSHCLSGCEATADFVFLPLLSPDPGLAVAGIQTLVSFSSLPAKIFVTTQTTLAGKYKISSLIAANSLHFLHGITEKGGGLF
jgi:hypothetical protein